MLSDLVTPRDVLLLQMGKVSSTSLAQALGAQGFNTQQAHIASTSRLGQKLDTLSSPTMTDGVADRVYADFLRELEVTYMLSRRKLDKAGRYPKLRVISPMRDPMTWFWSHVAELFDHYTSQMQRFHRLRGGSDTDFDVGEVFLDVQRLMFKVLDEVEGPIHRAASLAAVRRVASQYDESDVTAAALNRFLLPLRWFDEDFRPATDINVYKHAFDDEAGFGRIEQGGLSVLLLRYENLQVLLPEIARFTGLESLELPRANTSERKNLPIDIRKMQSEGRSLMPASVERRIFSSPYCRHFGYTPIATAEAANA